MQRVTKTKGRLARIGETSRVTGSGTHARRLRPQCQFGVTNPESFLLNADDVIADHGVG
jgi:hypothetical protein